MNGNSVALPLTGLWTPDDAYEEWFPFLDKEQRKAIGDRLMIPLKDRLDAMKRPFKDWVTFMAGTMGFTAQKAMNDAALGAIAFTGTTPLFWALWNSTVDASVVGNTAGETSYTGYSRLSHVNSATVYAAGSGTISYTKTFPEALKSFASSSGGTGTVNYLVGINGNAGSSADKGYYWCSVTSTTINNGDTPQIAAGAVTVVQT